MIQPFPTLGLDFTNAVLDPRITFTRAGATATRVNSSGYIEVVAANTARFNYNPVTLACKGLLIESAITNGLEYNETFITVWAYTGATGPIRTFANPKNVNSTVELVEDSSNGQHRINRAKTGLAAGTYSFSVYGKKNTRQYLQMVETASTANRAVFDLNAGTVFTSAGSPNATIELDANGFYRCSISATIGAGGTFGCGISLSTGGNGFPADSYQGDGTSGLYIYGAQFESGTKATSLILTDSTVVTRNADVATVTGSNFTSFWNSVQGGTSVQATPSIVSGITPLVQFDDGTANEIIALRGNTTNPELYIVDGGTPQVQLDAGTIAANTAYSLTGWWATNDCKARKDSGTVVTDTTATIPTVTQMRIGSDGTNYLNGTIAAIDYYDSFFGQPIYTRRKNKVFPSLL
jgi:hypothetical protein